MVVRANRYAHGIILAGIHLWENSMFDSITPRPLLPVGPYPLIGHVLRWLRQGGIRHATICANSASRFVRRYVGDGRQWGLEIDYYEDWTPRGPAGCARDAALGSGADTHVVVDGSTIPQVDLGSLLEAHERTRPAVTIVVSPEVVQSGAAPARLAPAGIYAFRRDVLESAREVGYQDIKEVLIPHLHALGMDIATFAAAAVSPRISGFASYLQANGWLLQRLAGEPEPLLRYRQVGQAHVHRDARVDGSSRLIGPMLIGPEARVGAGATIVGPSILGAESVLEDGAVVCRSVLWEYCHLGSGAMVDHCVLTQGAQVEPGERLYNTVRTALPAARGPLGWLRSWRTWREGKPAMTVAPALGTPTPARGSRQPPGGHGGLARGSRRQQRRSTVGR